MAYVLSRYSIDSSTCTGQHFIKLNPLTSSATPVWAKISTGSCRHLGLIFGRTESLLYAFSQYNSMATLSLLDSDGIQQWSYALSNGFDNTLLYFKAIDASTDMVVATSKSGTVIKYSRILSSSASPYSVQLPGSQTYQDTTTLSSQVVRGLYISSLTTTLALIFDNTNKWTDLATIDFTIPQVTYKRTFPLMTSGIMRIGVFMSDSVYYVGTRSNGLY